MMLAQISDTHILAEGRVLYGRIDTARHLERAVEHLNRLAPDFVLMTGDLADDGSPEGYANLRRLLRPLAPPFAVIPGNHDHRENLKAAFPELPGCGPEDRFVQFTVEDYPLRLVALDTLVPGEDGGTLCQVRLDWLAARLDEQPGRPTLIAMHHPPFAIGHAGLDAIGCANGPALAALVERHPQVRQIVCGHVHRPISVRWGATVVTTAPSTAHQVALDFAPDAPILWRPEPPACHLHCWSETGLVTHLSYIDDYGPPQPYE